MNECVLFFEGRYMFFFKSYNTRYIIVNFTVYIYIYIQVAKVSKSISEGSSLGYSYVSWLILQGRIQKGFLDPETPCQGVLWKTMESGKFVQNDLNCIIGNIWNVHSYLSSEKKLVV